MLEVIIFVGVLLIILVVRLLDGRTDNTEWLEVKEAAQRRMLSYRGEHAHRIMPLVVEFAFCCDEIAACRYIFDAKRGLMYANRATDITMQLSKLGFFEKTQEEEDGECITAR